MSTDVSGMIECRPGARLWGLDDEDSVWEVGIDLFLLNRGNAYDGLACLFGIRNYFGFRPLAEDRGFPDDASEGLRDEFARYGGPHDVHGTTWLTWAELETTDWQEADASGTRTRAARRLEVYDRIIERFGSERVAVTGMPETWRARHALRDTGLALGLPPRTVDRIAKSFPHIRACDIRGALKELPELRQLAAEADSYGPLWELAEGLDALPGGIAMHPCGVILSNATLLDRLPVQPTRGGQYPMVQADKEDVEDLGLLKLDVLGVRMQSAMAHAVTEIRRTTGRQIDLDNPDHVPLDDQFAFALIQDSDTVGMFQLDSVSSPAVLRPSLSGAADRPLLTAPASRQCCMPLVRAARTRSRRSRCLRCTRSRTCTSPPGSPPATGLRTHRTSRAVRHVWAWARSR